MKKNLEERCFDWLAELGYECLMSDEVSLGGSEEDQGLLQTVRERLQHPQPVAVSLDDLSP
ncbi:MAG: hypothetical protein B7X52_05290 [Thiotrichales bacterium 34-46-19]|nr:MAG: hypothetical protein B7X52_05290 [Thiotrichales bacterium 34-46-19]HQT03913.1 hypothetical protein [Thiotrichales bacterium]